MMNGSWLMDQASWPRGGTRGNLTPRPALAPEAIFSRLVNKSLDKGDHLFQKNWLSKLRSYYQTVVNFIANIGAYLSHTIHRLLLHYEFVRQLVL